MWEQQFTCWRVASFQQRRILRSRLGDLLHHSSKLSVKKPKKTSCSHRLLCWLYTQTETTSLREARSQKNACCISATVDLKIRTWPWNDCTMRHGGYLSQINERNACLLVRLAFSFISFILESLAKLKCRTEERLEHIDRATEIRRVFNFITM